MSDQVDIIEAGRKLDRLLASAYSPDEPKTVYTPWRTLAREMIRRLPSIHGDILVLSDLGILYAVLERLLADGSDFSKVRFVAHNRQQAQVARMLGLKSDRQILPISYNYPIKKLGELFMGLPLFNIIIGNPPYQHASKDQSGAKPWIAFFEKRFAVLADSGFIAFVTPITWHKGEFASSQSGRVYALMQTHQTHYIDWNANSKEAFSDVNETFTYFVLEKAPAWKDTIVFDGKVSHSVNLRDHGSLPLDLRSLSIIEKINRHAQKIDIRHGKRIAPQTTGKKRMFYNSAKWAFTDADADDSLKIIWPFGSYFYHPKKPDIYCVVDNVVAGDNTQYILVGDEDPENIKSIIHSRLYRFVNHMFKTSVHNVGVKKFPKICFKKRWTDAEIYRHFGLTDDEVRLIEEVIPV